MVTLSDIQKKVLIDNCDELYDAKIDFNSDSIEEIEFLIIKTENRKHCIVNNALFNNLHDAISYFNNEITGKLQDLYRSV